MHTPVLLYKSGVWWGGGGYTFHGHVFMMVPHLYRFLLFSPAKLDDALSPTILDFLALEVSL